MLRILWSGLKICIFALIVLIAGSRLKIGNHTVSDEIQIRLSHAEQSSTLKKVKSWANVFFGSRKFQENLPDTSQEREKIRKLLIEIQKPDRTAHSKK